jgi:hypothetical protein
MLITTLIVTLILAGLAIWVLNSFFPNFDYRIKQLIYALIIIYVILTILAAFGVQVPILGKLLQ